LLYKIPGRDPVPDGSERIPLGVSKLIRDGKDLTLVATGIMVNKAYAVVEKLAAEGISIALIDPRTISPLDMGPIVESVETTGRLLVVQEGPSHGGFINEVIARISESSAFGSLIAPIKRLAGMNIPIPYAPQLEKAAVPQIEDIEAAAREIVKSWR
jgi:pyruvate/2-oxoglutarate/acetoin dehydrogenase E1 component